MTEKRNIRPRGPRDPVAGPDAGPEPPFPIKLSGPVIKGFGRGSRELGIPTANIPPTGLADHPDLTSGVYFGFVGLHLAPHTVQSADNSKLTLSSSSSLLSSSSSASTRTTSPSPSSPSPSPTPVSQSQPQSQSSRLVEDGDSETTTTTTAAAASESKDVTAESTSVYPAVLSIGYNPYYKNETRSIEIHILHHFPHYNFYYSPLNLLILGFIRPEYDYESLDALVADIKTDCQVARRSLERPNWKKWRQDEWLRAFGWVDEQQAAGRGLVDVKKLEAEVIGARKEEEGEGEAK